MLVHDDLRYGLLQYSFASASYSTFTWPAATNSDFSLVDGMPRRYMQSFNNSVTWVISHNFNTKYVFVCAQDNIMNDITSLALKIYRNQNDVTITWGAPQTGRVIIGAL